MESISPISSARALFVRVTSIWILSPGQMVVARRGHPGSLRSAVPAVRCYGRVGRGIRSLCDGRCPSPDPA
jgi:hypothetical protein